jgi:transposase-like protein
MSKRSEAEGVKTEVEEGEVGDRRLGKRCEKLVAARSGRIGSSLSVACQDWANTKAAYRFLANARGSEREMLAGHFHSTRERVKAREGPVLGLHDTTEFSFKRQEQAASGLLRKLPM